MQKVRKCALVVCLVAAMTANASTQSLVDDISQTFPSGDILTAIIDFVLLYGRLSLPPG